VNVTQAPKPRPRREWIMVLVQPLASRGVLWLARARVSPIAVVLAHGCLGLVAAALLSAPDAASLVAAALLLQAKTLLDNMDGGLARATGTVTEAGRYLDTVVDLTVNVALFLALARHGPAVPALLALVALTLLLSLDHTLEARYRELRGERESTAPALPPGAPAWLLNAPRAVYAALLAPQDRLFTRLDDALFGLAAGMAEADAPAALRLAWSDLFSTASVVNLGLSTQLALLGALALAGRPYLYVPLVLLQLVYAALVQTARVLRFRRSMGVDRGSAA